MDIQTLKNKIVEKNIISKEDLPKASNEHIIVATYFLLLSENTDIEYETNNYELEKFNEEIYRIQDLLELRDCDVVKENKSFESEGSIKMGIPKNIIPLLRSELFPEMIRELEQ
jgi:hypothetical protein